MEAVMYSQWRFGKPNGICFLSKMEGLTPKDRILFLFQSILQHLQKWFHYHSLICMMMEI